MKKNSEVIPEILTFVVRLTVAAITTGIAAFYLLLAVK
jgi:hypothetical protein